MAEIHIHHGHGSSDYNKGNLIHGSKADYSKLGELVNEAIKNNFYISILPPNALNKEGMENGDVILFFDVKRLNIS